MNPPSKPDALSPFALFEVKKKKKEACVLKLRVNVSYCCGVTGLYSRLCDPVLGLKSFFLTWAAKSAERVRQQSLFVKSSVCPLLGFGGVFCPFFPSSLCQLNFLIQIQARVQSFNYNAEEHALIHILYLDTDVCF